MLIDIFSAGCGGGTGEVTGEGDGGVTGGDGGAGDGVYWVHPLTMTTAMSISARILKVFILCIFQALLLKMRQ